jgi:hypothetical protein
MNLHMRGSFIVKLPESGPGIKGKSSSQSACVRSKICSGNRSVEEDTFFFFASCRALASADSVKERPSSSTKQMYPTHDVVPITNQQNMLQ